MNLKAVIIDDEENNIDNLQRLLNKYCREVTVIDTACNVEEGQKIIQQSEPDLVFLDIQMPDKSGFDLLNSLVQHNFEIIFVTAYDHYGIQAIKFAAIDYLLKPVNIEELQIAVKKAAQKRMEKSQNLQLENLLQLLQQQSKDKHRIALPLSKETRFVPIEDIIRCESSNNYTTFYFINQDKLLVSKPIYEYEEILASYHFIRCHQSHLVNKRFIKSWIKEDGGYLLLEDQTQIPVSRQKKEYLKAVLLQS